MQNLINRSAVLTFLLFLLLVSSPFAATYIVDRNHPSSNNSNPGTEALPWKTLQYAIDRANAGDVVRVKQGTYNEKITFKRSGTASAYITFVAFDAAKKPIIDAAGRTDTKIVQWSSSSNHYIIFDGFVVRNAPHWAIWIQGNNNIVRNCVVHNVLRSGISVVGGSNNLIARNEVYNIGNVSLGKIGNSIHIEAVPSKGLTGNNNIVEYNKIYDNASHFGVNIFPETQGSQLQMSGNIIRFNNIDKCLGGIYTRYQTNFEIHNNIITNSLDNGIWFHIHNSAPSSANTYTANGKIYNNTIVGTTNVGLMNNTSNGLSIINNLFYDNGMTTAGGQEHIRMDKLSGHNIKNNLYFGKGFWKWAGIQYKTYPEWKARSNDLYSLHADPKVVNRNGLNFQLNSGSPAINAGASLGPGYNKDIVGTSRPQSTTFDIGAYEFASGSTSGGNTGGGTTTVTGIPLFATQGRLFQSAALKARNGSLGSQVAYTSNMKGYIEFTVTVPVAGTYYAWGRFFYHNNGTGNNSFKIKAGSTERVFGNRNLFNTWHWDGNGSQGNVSLGHLTAGTHKITILANEPGSAVMLDMIVLTTDPSFIPSDAIVKNLKKEGAEESVPETFTLTQNFPNPFNPSTKIRYSVPAESMVELKVYDVLGAEVMTLVNDFQTAGHYEVDFNAASLASGTYIYRLTGKNFIQTKKMILLK